MAWTGFEDPAVLEEDEAEVALATARGMVVVTGRAAGVLIYFGDVSQPGKADSRGLLASGRAKVVAVVCWLGMERPASMRMSFRWLYRRVSAVAKSRGAAAAGRNGLARF